MISRYTRPEMGRIWHEENKFRCWLRVETAASLTLAEAGIVPEAAAKAIAELGDFDLKRIHEVEAEVKHDVIAFTTAVAEKVGPEARWFHYGLTSNDVVDTAQALLIKQASEIISADLERLAEVLKRRAWEFKDTPQIGRTHGIHAEPITFGLKLAGWAFEVDRGRGRLAEAIDAIGTGKISGPVGTYSHLGPDVAHRLLPRHERLRGTVDVVPQTIINVLLTASLNQRLLIVKNQFLNQQTCNALSLFDLGRNLGFTGIGHCARVIGQGI